MFAFTKQNPFSSRFSVGTWNTQPHLQGRGFSTVSPTPDPIPIPETDPHATNRGTQKLGQGTAMSVDTITKTQLTEKGSIIERTVVRRWNSMSRNKRIALGIYFGTVAAAYFSKIYDDGYYELMRHRLNSTSAEDSSKPLVPSNEKRRLELDAIAKGCKSNSIERFWESVIFPYTAVTTVVPYAILAINPPASGTNVQLTKPIAGK